MGDCPFKVMSNYFITLEQPPYLFNYFLAKVLVSRLDFTDSGSVIPQLTVPKVRILQIPVPPLNIQQQLVAEVEQLEAKITEAQTVLDNATDRKNTILTTYL